MRKVFRILLLIFVVTLGILFWFGSGVVKQEEQAAEKLGFADRTEYKKAEKAGFKDPATYRANLRKIAEDKLNTERAALWDSVDHAVKQLGNAQTIGPVGNAVGDSKTILRWREIYNQANTLASSQEEKKKLDVFEARLSAAQKTIFPKLRSAYIKAANEKLWIEDGKVKSGGVGRIVFYHGSFLLNRNIQKMADELHLMLSVEYRFRELCFAPYEGANMTCYDLKPSPDGTI